MEIKIRPSFLLRGINPGVVLNKYLDGAYTDLVQSNKKVEIKLNSLSFDRKVTDNPDDEIYEFITRAGESQRIVTVNHNQTNRIDGKFMCKWCRRLFEHHPVGIPILQQYDPIDNLSIFHIDGNYCCFECMYAKVIIEVQLPYSIRKPGYESMDVLARKLFSLVYPNRKLNRSRDWSLLNINGGSLNEKEYFSSYHEYKEIINIQLVPHKRRFVVTENNKHKINIKK